MDNGPDSGDDGIDDEEGELVDEPVSAFPPEVEYHTGLPPKLEAWRQRSATGAILTGFALGLQQALEPKRDEPAVIQETSGDPPKDLPVEADFEYRRPRHSVVNIRPWLLDSPEPDRAAADGEPPADAAPPQS